MQNNTANQTPRPAASQANRSQTMQTLTAHTENHAAAIHVRTSQTADTFYSQMSHFPGGIHAGDTVCFKYAETYMVQAQPHGNSPETLTMLWTYTPAQTADGKKVRESIRFSANLTNGNSNEKLDRQTAFSTYRTFTTDFAKTAAAVDPRDGGTTPQSDKGKTPKTPKTPSKENRKMTATFKNLQNLAKEINEKSGQKLVKVVGLKMDDMVAALLANRKAVKKADYSPEALLVWEELMAEAKAPAAPAASGKTPKLDAAKPLEFREYPKTPEKFSEADVAAFHAEYGALKEIAKEERTAAQQVRLEYLVAKSRELTAMHEAAAAAAKPAYEAIQLLAVAMNDTMELEPAINPNLPEAELIAEIQKEGNDKEDGLRAADFEPGGFEPEIIDTIKKLFPSHPVITKLYPAAPKGKAPKAAKTPKTPKDPKAPKAPKADAGCYGGREGTNRQLADDQFEKAAKTEGGLPWETVAKAIEATCPKFQPSKKRIESHAKFLTEKGFPFSVNAAGNLIAG